MVNKSRMMPAVLAVAVVVAFLTTGCIRWSTQSRPVVNGPAAAEFAVALRNRVSTDAMMAHLSKLQDIANANDGTRAVGTPGYQASVDYVVNTLRNSGFDVQTPEFSARVFKAEKGVVTLGGNTVEARALEYSLGTDTTTVGLNTANIGSRFLMSLVNPTVTLEWKAAILIARAST